MRAGGAGRGPLLPGAAAAILALLLTGVSSSFADSIYVQTEKDGTIHLTNAPSREGFHTYLSTGRFSGADEAPPGLYGEQIRKAASTYGVDPSLVRAVIGAESNFDPRAVSSKGAQGLMQLMPSTAVRFGVRDVFDPTQNILGGVRYLRYLLDLFEGDLVLTLAAYNAGERVVQDAGGVPRIRETREYVDRVLSRYGSPGRSARVSPLNPQAAAKPGSPAKARIFRSVSADGTPVFSDSPIPKPVQD